MSKGAGVSRSRAKGTAFETAVVRCLRSAGYNAHRNPLYGAYDIGDIGGVSLNCHDVAIECKNEHDYHISEWLREVADEMHNAGADAGFVVFHQRGKGFDTISGALQQPVLMTLDDLLTIASGTHNDIIAILDSLEEKIARVREDYEEDC